jgi:hypothetical protein
MWQQYEHHLFANPVADCDEGKLLQVSQFLTAFGTFYRCAVRCQRKLLLQLQ